MQIETEAQVTRLIAKPWFSWIVGAIITGLSLVGYFALVFYLPGKAEIIQNAMQPVKWAAMASAAAGLMTFFISPTTTYVLDRSARQVIRRKTALIWRSSKTIPFDQILNAELLEMPGSGVDMPPAFYIVLHLVGGKQHRVSDRSDRGYQPEAAKAMYQAVNRAIAGAASNAGVRRPRVGVARSFGRGSVGGFARAS